MNQLDYEGVPSQAVFLRFHSNPDKPLMLQGVDGMAEDNGWVYIRSSQGFIIQFNRDDIMLLSWSEVVEQPQEPSNVLHS